ncbi:MAG TPA: crossover junction endodeoxyribonuclease RuvC [Pyrinomonadaceae bacterium]|jgi:crossover junction endodeoxyribonuclease RuvC|nr:crossover junction endodeoxyribonuclease RuvC [Pyrinomonadaceae bacterium]
MRVLGIDPGSETTGWGVVEGDVQRYRIVDFGTVKANPRERFATRLLKISDGVEELLARFRPDVCAVEEMFFAANVKTALKLGQVRGVILVAAERARIEIAEYAPRLVKQTVVGYGAAEKHQVQEMVRVLLSLDEIPQPHDASDALALAICHFHHAGLAARTKAAAPARTKLDALLAANPRRRAPR